MIKCELCTKEAAYIYRHRNNLNYFWRLCRNCKEKQTNYFDNYINYSLKTVEEYKLYLLKEAL